MTEIKFFVFLMCVFFVSKLIFDFFIRFTQQNPKPIELSFVSETLLFVSLSYIITYLRF
jgi:hypothetical protein